ncbi:MAG TPA: hypothetical protein VHV55_21590 [Pirellulales bacterium]|jgi:hypothetical protein|nr:hypothetical protein [Pirellulales bacterium]
MRRFRRPSPQQSVLSGREVRRIISMIGMLGILWLLASRAADPNMWKFFATAPEAKDSAANAPGAGAPAAPQSSSNPPTAIGGDAQDPAIPQAPPAAAKKEDSYAWETIDPEPGLEGPLDADPEERDAAKEQFQALSDKEDLAAVDMPAYWRLMRWSRNQSFNELQKRAKRGGVDVMFTHFAQEPEKHRGELVQLKLRVVRVVRFDAPENPAGMKQTFEAWGVTDNDSLSNPYVVVFSEKPPELPLGAKVEEDAMFVGYFLKDISYEAYNTRRFAPLLIGRLRWRDNPAAAMLRDQKSNPRDMWLVLGIGLTVLTATVGSWIWRMRHPKKRSAFGSDDQEHQAVQDWIEKAEQGEGPDDEQTAGHDVNLPGRRAVAGALDWIDPNRHNESP